MPFSFQLLIALRMNIIEQLYRLLRPLFPALILAILGILCVNWRRYRIATGSLLLGALWMWLCCTPAFAIWLQQRLAHQYPQKAAAAYPKVDAIVVLGGGELPRAGSDWGDDPTDTQATRAGFGLQLFMSSRADIILLSGGEQEAMQMAHELQQQGVPANALQTENASMSTYQNALYSAAILRREKLQRILLVTSAMHMPRALACFKRQGLTAIPAPAVGTDRESPHISHLWRPQRAALRLSDRCLREYLGLWCYKLLGWA